MSSAGRLLLEGRKIGEVAKIVDASGSPERVIAHRLAYFYEERPDRFVYESMMEQREDQTFMRSFFAHAKLHL